MAIDHRILQSITSRDNTNVLNMFQDSLNAQLNRDVTQGQIDQRRVQTDILGQQRDFANRPETQLLREQGQQQEIAQVYAQSLRPLLESGNVPALLQQLEQNKARLTQLGIPTAGVDEDIEQAQTAEGLEQLRTEVQATLTKAGGGQKQFALQSNAPITDPVTGQVSTPVFDPATGQTALVPIKGAIQETPTQIAARKFETAKGISELEVSETKAKETVKARVSRTSSLKKEFSERRRLAARSTRKVKEAQKLAQNASQGVAGRGRLALSRLFPGIDASDEGALSSAFKSLALDELQKFKGPTTDFEFAVTEDIAGSLGNSASANLARLSSLERANWFADRESQQFNDHIKGGHDPDEFFFNFNELVTPKKGGKSYSLKSLQDTAVANHISIDEVIKRLSR